MRILVVVDDPGTHSIVVGVLEERYRVEVAPDGEAALEAIGRQAPDLVLIARMAPPAQDGLGLLREIRSRASTSGIPVVLLAARDEEDWRIQGFEAGADDHLVMPLSPRELLARLGSRLEMFRIRKDAASREHASSEALLRDADGAPARIIGTVQDITERKRTGDALRESEERFRTMADSAPAMIWVTDNDGNNLFVNRAYCDFFGTAVDEVEGSRWQPLIHPDDAGAYVEGFRAAMTARKAFHARARVRHREGEWRWLESHGVPRFAPSGELLGMVGISSDVTESKLAAEALERSQEDLRNAQTVARVGSWRINVRGDALDWSAETYRIFGIAQGTPMTYETFLAAVHPDDRDHVNRSWQAALHGQPYDVEHRIVVSGDIKWVREVAHLEFDSGGTLCGGFGTVQDITDRKMMEQALADASRRKDEFLAVLSHELRNPLAPVRNSLYVLARAEPGGEQARRMQAIIERQVSHLTRLVDDLLDVTRISRGKIQLQRARIELGELVRRTVEDHRSTFTANGIRLEGRVASSPMWLSADGTRIAQVVGNLLGNAAKFTPRGGRVDLSLEQEGANAVLRVRDSGAGITNEMLERLFEPFMQADRTLDRARGGLGLGLALVKGLAELHGGSVTATSEGPGRGAEFVVRLPLSPATEKAVANGETGRVAPRRVLIIEDNIDAAGSLKEALELDGHEVEVAYDGPEGLTKARAFQPEVVLCDIGLPGMDGYEVARAFRADDALAGAFLVALTGYALPEDLQRAEDAGFERHLAKPPTFEKLSELLEEAGHVHRGGVRA
jgi:PAS domain S-box-containing protein